MRNLIHQILFTIIVVFTTISCLGQSDYLYFNRVTDLNKRFFRKGDTLWEVSGICKPLKVIMRIDSVSGYGKKEVSKTPLFKISGNIQYDFIYRSLVDTPFTQTGFAQHTLQSTFDASYRGIYPVRITLLARKTNSPYFDNMADINVQFNNSQFIQNLHSGLEKQLIERFLSNEQKALALKVQRSKWEAEALQNWLSEPRRIQEIIEAKEKQISDTTLFSGGLGNDLSIQKVDGSLSGKIAQSHLLKGMSSAFVTKLNQEIDSLQKVKDSLALVSGETLDTTSNNSYQKLQNSFAAKRRELDSIQKRITKDELEIRTKNKSIQDSISQLRQQLQQLKDPSQVRKFLSENNLPESALPKGWKLFTAVKTLGIGRTWIDYSELTVKNISLTGVNMEFNPGKIYLAFAAGKINYRFRDFIVKSGTENRQKLYLLRAGIGNLEANHLIFTGYGGRRNMLNSDMNNPQLAGNLERVVGFSLQSRLQIDRNSFLLFEVAKSSFHNTGTVNQPANMLVSKALNFKIRSNEAWSVKGGGYLPVTNTRLVGYYRKMGENFQSFNIQPLNVSQEAYQLKIQQAFWKRKLTVEAGLRKNDFANPLINPGISSKTVFKSLFLTLRVPRYPFISIGYYPCSQLTVLDNNIIVENQYNTFSSTVSYGYRVKGMSMTSTAVYLKFFNSGADTGFVYYNASSLSIAQHITGRKLYIQTGFTSIDQQNLKVKTIEGLANYQIKDWFNISAGTKCNLVYKGKTLWGATAGMGVRIKEIGSVQLSYEKSFLPGTASNLLPVDWGRLTYYKTF